jgi:cobaltochelatase CobS
MPPNSAYYYYDETRQTLRHGHTFPDKPGARGEHWHRAAQPHPDYPTLHDDIRAYDPYKVDWSDKNYSLGWNRKSELVEEAYTQHNRAIQERAILTGPIRPAPAPLRPANRSYDWLAEATNAPTTTQEPTPAPEPAPDPEEPASEDEIVELLAALPGRVDGLEASQRQQLSDDMELRGTVARINSRTSELDTKVLDLKRDFSDLENESKHLNQALTTQVGALGERIKPLEEAAARRLIIEVRQPNAAPVIHDEGTYHHKFPLLLRLATHLSGSRRNIWLAGPAGSGKTTAAHQVADKLGLPFDSHGAIRTPFQVTGHYDIHGTYRSSQFRRIFENGGVILLDETDASDPNAMMELNQALSNSKMSFPDGTIDRHPDCIVIASANTWGFGGDANYVARYKADAASLDRFATVSWDYDPNFERALASNDEWCSIVQQVRAAAEQQEAKIVISPRATLNGCELINSGAFTNEEIVEVVFGRYRQIDDWPTIGRAAEDFARRGPAPATQEHPAYTDKDRDEAVLAEVRQMLTANPSYTIPAIKMWREHKGISLREAKDFIDNLKAQMNGHPSPTTPLGAVDFSRVVVYNKR